ncbi:MAG: MerR family transcriptional regulator, partial [Clostridium sp.]|nr:MerR family transcriptional regulator [Clostridium sp.]
MQIGEISKLTGLSISTLRYYDKHGLLNNLERTEGGIRTFSEQNIEALKLINCLKNSGMKISEIKQFMEWCTEGKKTFNKRLNMFYEQEKNIKEQIDVLNKSLKLIKFKQWYYETAIKEGTEDNVRKLDVNKMPKDIAKL